jgi:hypothetical protein
MALHGTSKCVGSIGQSRLVPEIVVAILDDEFPEHIPLLELAVEPLLLWDWLI